MDNAFREQSKLIDFQVIDKKLELEIEEAFRKAKADPFPDPSETFEKIYSDEI